MSTISNIFAATAFLSFITACSQPANDPNIAVNNPYANNASARTPSPTATPTSGNTAVSPTTTLSPLPPDAKGVQSAIDIVHAYYDSINARDYRKAYELWAGKGEASKQTFEEFRDGFANTASVEIDTSGEPGDLEGAAGSQYVTIPLRIKAKTKDGKEQNFGGEYVLRRSMVDGASAEQREWRLYSASIEAR